MSRYIDANKLEDELYEHEFSNWCDKDEVSELIDNMPTADVVEAVRCKDCKYHEELLNGKDGNVICWVHDIDAIVDRNGYCDHGEPKEQEHGHI